MGRNRNRRNKSEPTTALIDGYTVTGKEVEQDKPITAEEYKEIEKDLEAVDVLNSEIQDDIVEAYNEALVYSKYLDISVEAVMGYIMQRNISDGLLGFRITKKTP